MYARKWLKLNNIWYYFNNNGDMVTGFKDIDGSTYYFDENGTMLTGKQVIENQEYFFNDNGQLYKNIYEIFSLSLLFLYIFWFISD